MFRQSVCVRERFSGKAKQGEKERLGRQKST